MSVRPKDETADKDRLAAIQLLLAVGWTKERIAGALRTSWRMVERARQSAPPEQEMAEALGVAAARFVRQARPFSVDPGFGCCYPLGKGRYCDAPVLRPWMVHCVEHNQVRWAPRA